MRLTNDTRRWVWLGLVLEFVGRSIGSTARSKYGVRIVEFEERHLVYKDSAEIQAKKV